MAKYATTEIIYECTACNIHCAKREMVKQTIGGETLSNGQTISKSLLHNCPKCGLSILTDGLYVQRDYERLDICREQYATTVVLNG